MANLGSLELRMTPERYERLCELFDRVQAEPPDRRTALLGEVAATDTTLAADLRRMLADDQGAQHERLLQEPCPVNARAVLPTIESTVLAVPSERSEDDDTPPLVVGYSLDGGRLGAGGMGVVWLGRESALNRAVAFKVLRRRFAVQPDLVRRFVEEAQVASQLSHPAIPPVHALGTLADGRPFFVMKLVKGRTLSDLLAVRPGPADDLPRLVGIFEQVCLGVAYAHSKGVIHRDLKPANVMLGAFGEVQVMDWGLAKVLRRGGTEAATPADASVVRTVRAAPHTHTAVDTATQAGEVLGTPAYMAPEQARGKVDALDERCDVFGLGAILCHILTGRPPFDGTLETALVQARAGATAEALGRLDVSGADTELRDLARRCLAPEPARRPRDAAAVAGAVAGYQESVQARLRRAELERAAAEVKAEEEAKTRAVAEAKAVAERRARRLLVGFAALLLTLAAVAAGAGLYAEHHATGRRADQARRDVEQRARVEAALDKAASLQQQARWAEAGAVLDQARRGLGDAGWEDLRQRLDDATARLALGNHLDGIRQRRVAAVEDQPEERTAVEQEYERAFRDAGLGAPGDDEAAVAERVRASGVTSTVVAALDDWAALEATKPGAREWALGVARRAEPHPWGDRVRDPAVWKSGPALQALADELLRKDADRLGDLSPQLLGRIGWVLAERGNALPLLEAALRRHPGDFWLNFAMGRACGRSRRWADAASYCRAAVALRPDVAVAHHNLGFALYGSKRVAAAAEEFRRAIALDRALAPAHYMLGNCLDALKDPAGAIAEYRKAINLEPHHARAHNNLGALLREQGALDDALAEFRWALEIDSKLLQARHNLGDTLARKGQLDDALAEFQRALDIDPRYALAHQGIGLVMVRKKEFEAAIAAYQRAIAGEPALPSPYYHLGNVLRNLNRAEEAIAAFRKAIDLGFAFPEAANELGILLRDKKDLDGAAKAFRRALAIAPDAAWARFNLGLTLYDQGRFKDALGELRRSDELGRKLPDWESPTALIRDCERLGTADEKLPAVLCGEALPAGTAETIAMAQLCRRYQARHAAAARLYAAAFAADPKLLDDPRSSHLYDAARSAALASSGRDADARRVPDREAVVLRREALRWLRADLRLCARTSAGREVGAVKFVREKISGWQRDAELASVRDGDGLARMPEPERQEWVQLWQDVSEFLHRLEPQP